MSNQDAVKTKTSDENIYLRKVPEVAFGFWVIKIVATTLGEIGGNAVSLSLDLGYLLGSIIFGIPLVMAIIAQIKAKKFNSSLYWATITLTTLAGATVANSLDKPIASGGLGFSDITLTGVFFVIKIFCLLIIPQRSGRH